MTRNTPPADVFPAVVYRPVANMLRSPIVLAVGATSNARRRLSADEARRLAADLLAAADAADRNVYPPVVAKEGL